MRLSWRWFWLKHLSFGRLDTISIDTPRFEKLLDSIPKNNWFDQEWLSFLRALSKCGYSSGDSALHRLCMHNQRLALLLQVMPENFRERHFAAILEALSTRDRNGRPVVAEVVKTTMGINTLASYCPAGSRADLYRVILGLHRCNKQHALLSLMQQEGQQELALKVLNLITLLLRLNDAGHLRQDAVVRYMQQTNAGGDSALMLAVRMHASTEVIERLFAAGAYLTTQQAESFRQTGHDVSNLTKPVELRPAGKPAVLLSACGTGVSDTSIPAPGKPAVHFNQTKYVM